MQGAAHLRNTLPNQDHIDWYPRIQEQTGLPLIMAVSDGHGSAKCFRSGTGAQLATKSARDVIKQFLSSEIFPADLSRIKHLFEEGLPRDVVRNWQQAVDSDLQKNPFTDDEFSGLESKEGLAVRAKIENNPYIAYGATLLVVFITETFLAILQLGDGDILVVSESGEVSRPLPLDERLIANETTSLSDKLAWQNFRTNFISLASQPPALITLSSDGYSNSFRNDVSFLKIGVDFLEMLREDSSKAIRHGLKTWLNEASQLGSGDDITLGLIYRLDAIQPASMRQGGSWNPDVD